MHIKAAGSSGERCQALRCDGERWWKTRSRSITFEGFFRRPAEKHQVAEETNQQVQKPDPEVIGTVVMATTAPVESIGSNAAMLGGVKRSGVCLLSHTLHTIADFILITAINYRCLMCWEGHAGSCQAANLFSTCSLISILQPSAK